MVRLLVGELAPALEDKIHIHARSCNIAYILNNFQLVKDTSNRQIKDSLRFCVPQTWHEIKCPYGTLVNYFFSFSEMFNGCRLKISSAKDSPGVNILLTFYWKLSLSFRCRSLQKIGPYIQKYFQNGKINAKSSDLLKNKTWLFWQSISNIKNDRCTKMHYFRCLLGRGKTCF